MHLRYIIQAFPKWLPVSPVRKSTTPNGLYWIKFLSVAWKISKTGKDPARSHWRQALFKIFTVLEQGPNYQCFCITYL